MSLCVISLRIYMLFVKLAVTIIKTSKKNCKTKLINIFSVKLLDNNCID